MPLSKSARIVVAEVANGFVRATLAFEVYEVYKPASVHEHMKEQTQPCQHRGTSWRRAFRKCGPPCRVFKQRCLHPDVTYVTAHRDAPHSRFPRIVRGIFNFPGPNPENQSARKVALQPPSHDTSRMQGRDPTIFRFTQRANATRRSSTPNATRHRISTCLVACS